MFRWFHNMRVGVKLLVIAVISILFLGALAYNSYMSTQRMAENAERMYSDNVEAMALLNEVADLAWHVRSEMLMSLATEDPMLRAQRQAHAAENEATVLELIDRFAAGSLTAAEEEAVAAFYDAWTQYTGIRESLALASNVDVGLAREMASAGQEAGLHQAAMDALATLRAAKEAAAREHNEAIDAEADVQLRTIVVVVGAFILITIFINMIVGRTVSNAVGATSQLISRVADGELNVEELDISFRDEVGSMAQAVNQMVVNLRDVINQVNMASEELTASSTQLSATAKEAGLATQQIAATMEQVAAGTSDQSRAVQEAAHVMSELNKAIEQIAMGAERQAKAVQTSAEVMQQMVSEIEATAKNAEEVAQSAFKAMETARSGEGSVRETVAGMQQIQETVLQTAEKVRELGGHSNKVGEIVQVISDIADQTNLLALNAAIEAARAGEHGKGFAVVADEVRKLAERSAASAKEIAQLIESMREGIDEAVRAMEEGTDRVQMGQDLARRAGAAIDAILEALSDTNDQVQTISEAAQRNTQAVHEMTRLFEDVATISNRNISATEQMAAHSERVNASIQNISAVSEETAASAEEVSASTEEMNASFEQVTSSIEAVAHMATRLQELVRRFKL